MPSRVLLGDDGRCVTWEVRDDTGRILGYDRSPSPARTVEPGWASPGVLAVPPADGVRDLALIRGTLDAAARVGADVVFPRGATYVVSATDSRQDVISIPGAMTVDLNGSTVQLAANPFTHYNLIAVTGGGQVTIKGGTLRGDRLTHDYTTTAGTHEFGYGIYMDGGRLTVEDVEAYDFTGDGACIIGDATSTATFRRFHTHHNRRQGVSVLAFGTVLFDDCHIHDIGTSDGIAGTAPMAGIDLEPASRSMRIERVTIRDTRIDCPVKAFVDSHDVGTLLIDGCDLAGQVLLAATHDRLRVRDTSIRWAYVDAYAVPSFGADAVVTDCDLAVNRWRVEGNWTNVRAGSIPNPDKLPTRLYVEAGAILAKCEFSGFSTVEGVTVGELPAADPAPTFAATAGGFLAL